VRTTHWGHFARHYLEMVIAMVAGMVVLGGLRRGVVAVTGLDYSLASRPELAAFEMAFTMSVGMVVWMRYRRHSWASTLEMVGAMFAPVIALAPLIWLDILRSESLQMLSHVAMLLLMLVVMMRRRREYAR
jgi:hypothetical protein